MQKLNISRAKLENVVVERGPNYEMAALYRVARELGEGGVGDSEILNHLLTRIESALLPAKTLAEVQADCKARANKPRK